MCHDHPCTPPQELAVNGAMIETLVSDGAKGCQCPMGGCMDDHGTCCPRAAEGCRTCGSPHGCAGHQKHVMIETSVSDPKRAMSETLVSDGAKGCQCPMGGCMDDHGTCCPRA